MICLCNACTPNGIAYDIIKKKIPVINAEIAKVLANIVDFEIFFEASGNKFDIFIKHPQYDERPIEMASGAEKSLSAMAIRLALLGSLRCRLATYLCLMSRALLWTKKIWRVLFGSWN